jgi:ribosome biogenesis GTPase
MSLDDYGWNGYFSERFDSLNDPALLPARVLFSSGRSCRILSASGEVNATLAGRLRHESRSASELPVVGDWIAYRPLAGGQSRVERILERRSLISRKLPGNRSLEQTVAANIDTVLVMMGLDGDYNVRRLERLLTLAWESGARPAVLLNKADLCSDHDAKRAGIVEVAPEVPVVLLSCLQDPAVGMVTALIAPGETAALIGSSGVGKSTLVNRLLGEEVQATREVRQDDSRGRHTTSHRELFRLPGGGLLIDSPGIREVQLWAGGESLAMAFDDIEGLAAACRYRDCAHAAEPGCAVVQAVGSGALPSGRLESYRRLQAEIRALAARADPEARSARNRRWRGIHKGMRKINRTGRR